MANVKVYADELEAKNSEKILSNNPITLTETKPLNEMDGTDLVTKDNLIAVTGSFVLHTIQVGDPALYELTVDELAVVNKLGRYANFVAVISGTPYPAIQPTYDPPTAIGSFTNISVQLAPDGDGNAMETTFIQFS